MLLVMAERETSLVRLLKHCPGSDMSASLLHPGMLGLAFLLWLLLLLVSANRRVKEGDCRVGGRIKDWLLHCSHQSCPGPGTLPWHFTLAAATGSNLKLS